MSQGEPISIGRLVLVPALITLGVTILRLVGELQQWNSTLFNRNPGGGGGLIGIIWLVPVFGIYFAMKLGNSGERPTSWGKAAGFAALGLLLMGGGAVLFLSFVASKFQSMVLFLGAETLMVAAYLIPLKGWSKLSKTLLLYAFLARIPVAIVNFLSLRGSWGTHYEGAPPGFPADTPFWTKYLLIGLLPQVTVWVAITVVIGSLFGVAALALFGRKAHAAGSA